MEETSVSQNGRRLGITCPRYPQTLPVKECSRYLWKQKGGSLDIGCQIPTTHAHEMTTSESTNDDSTESDQTFNCYRIEFSVRAAEDPLIDELHVDQDTQTALVRFADRLNVNAVRERIERVFAPSETAGTIVSANVSNTVVQSNDPTVVEVDLMAGH